jgi:hypothetical protein
VRSNSEGANLELELMYCRAVELSNVLAPGDVLALEITEWVAVHDLIDHGLEMSARDFDLLGDLAVQLAAVLGEGDASACQEAQLLAETVELAFRHGGNRETRGERTTCRQSGSANALLKEGNKKAPTRKSECGQEAEFRRGTTGRAPVS